MSQNPTTRRQRTKTFSGCWTCRSRHVKCDEAKPACSRCQKAKLSCDGYNVRLSWTEKKADSTTSTASSQSQRRRIDAGPTPSAPYLSHSQIGIILTDLEESSSLEEKALPNDKTPFSVFSHRLQTLPLRFNPSHNVKESESTASSQAPSPAPETEALPSMTQLQQRRHAHFVEQASKLSLPQHLNLSIAPPQHLELIHHWNVFLCGNLLPVDTSNNPGRTTMLETALSAVVGTTSQPNARMALLHSICAASAQSIFQLKGQKGQFDLVAMKHEQLALGQIRRCIEAGVKEELLTILITIFTCVITEAVSGRAGMWRKHLQGGLSILGKIASGKGKSEQQLTPILQTYIWASAFCHVDIPNGLRVLLAQVPSSDKFLQQNFGVSPRLLGMLITINTMAASNVVLDVEQVDLIELELCLCEPPELDLSSIYSPSERVMQCITNIIYLAVVIHFQRSLRRSPTSELQPLVEVALEQIEAADHLEETNVGCSFVWPCLVISSECDTLDLQTRMSAWYESKRMFGFQNLQISHEIVLEVWRRRALGINTPDEGWQSVLASTDLDILPL